jgi:hypothetical protein
MSFWDEWDGRPDLPKAAGNFEVGKFDPNDKWIESAQENLQIEAMRRWFYARYEDPANETPYNGKEDGYFFINGGPHDPNDVIQERFSEVVEYEVMKKLIDDLWQEVGNEWAPIDSAWGEEEFLDISLMVVSRSDPARMLTDRLSQIQDALNHSLKQESQALLSQLLHSAVITALEAYLLDTVSYWARNDSKILERLVVKNPDFSKERFSYSSLFETMKKINETVDGYLQDFVWHRLDKVKPMFEAVFEIKFPNIEKIMKEIVVRHHIVHRGGRDKKGDPVFIGSELVKEVYSYVKLFSDELESLMEKRFPFQKESPF